MHDGLACNLTAVYADVEALYRFIGREDADAHLIEKQVDSTPLRVMKVEISGHMAARND
jgi:hypothetical protein